MYSVLYVDDEPDLLELGKLFLENTQEFSVDTAGSADEALLALKDHNYEAIVSDYQMPEMDGIAFLKKVRSSFGDIPFIIFTGRGREEIVIEALNNGADFYLQKGGEPNTLYTELMHVLRRTIEMRQAQATLAEQEQRYHDLQNASDLIQSVTPDGHFLFVNKKWQDTLGYSEQDLAGLTIFDVIAEESREHCRAVFPRVIAGENVGIIDAVFKTRTGEKIFVEGLTSCKITDGKPQYTRGIFKDVTDRRKTENALRESEEKFRTLVEYTLDGILILNPTGKILFANQAAGQLIETEKYHEMIGVKNVMEFIAPESQGDALRDFGKVAQGVDGYLARYKIVTSQLRERWVESIGKCIIFGGAPAILISLRDITDRQKAEAVVQESEEKFRTIFENSPYPISMNSIPDGRFIAVNKSFLQSSGYTEAEILGKTPVEIDLLSLLDFGRLATHMLVSGKLENVAMTMRGKGGKRVHVLFSTIPITINDKPAILTVTAEVTQLKRVEEELIRKNEDLNAAYEELTATEEELRENYNELQKQELALRASEEKYRLLTEVTNDIIYMIDTKGTVTHISPRISRYGYTPEEVISHNFTEFLAKDEAGRVVAGLNEALSTGKPVPMTIKIRDKEGNYHWLEDNGALISDPSGSVVSISGILRDVTERMNAENALRESEAKFRALVEHSLDGILITDFMGNLLFANQAAGSIVGIEDYETLIGKKNVLEFVAPESRAGVLHDFSQVAQGIDAYLVKYKLITETKREIWVECIGKKIPFGGSSAMLVSLRDITARKRMEDAILRTNRQLILLSSVTRHDVLNKISVILGHIAFSRKRGPDQNYPALIDKIETTIKIIRSQVEFTRVYQSLGTREPEWQKPGKFLSSSQVPDTIVLKNELRDLEIFGDLMLQKVFHNLIENSVRHGGGIREIRLHSCADAQGLTIVFEDDGIGIPDEEKERIFERGYGKNTGLGLFLAREILSITGITIRETGETGKGARFEIRVPADAYRIAQT